MGKPKIRLAPGTWSAILMSTGKPEYDQAAVNEFLEYLQNESWSAGFRTKIESVTKTEGAKEPYMVILYTQENDPEFRSPM